MLKLIIVFSVELDPSAMDNEASLAFYKLRGEKLENSNQEKNTLKL